MLCSSFNSCLDEDCEWNLLLEGKQVIDLMGRCHIEFYTNENKAVRDRSDHM